MTSKLELKTTGELIDEIPHLSDLDKQRLFKLHQKLDRVPLLEFQQIVWPEVYRIFETGQISVIPRFSFEDSGIKDYTPWSYAVHPSMPSWWEGKNPPTVCDLMCEGMRQDLFIEGVEIGTLGSKPLITHIFFIAEADVMILRGDFFAKAIPINLCGLRANVFYPENGEEKK